MPITIDLALPQLPQDLFPREIRLPEPCLWFLDGKLHGYRGIQRAGQ